MQNKKTKNPFKNKYLNVFKYLKRLVNKFIADGCTFLSSSIAYYFVFSIFPLMLVSISLSGILINSLKIQVAILDFIKDRIPIIYGFTQSNIEKIVENDTRVTFYGKYSAEQLGDIFESIDVLVIPSICYENYPMVLHEALVSNIPVIGTRLGVFVKKIKDGFNGFTFLPGNSDDLQKKMEQIINAPSLLNKMKENIKKIIQEVYTKLKNREYTLEELAFRVGLTKELAEYTKNTPQHVKAAKQLVSKGVELKPGDIISYVKVTTPVGVKPVQLARIDEIDADKYIGHIRTTFEQVLDALGIEFDEIIGVTTLDLFAKH